MIGLPVKRVLASGLAVGVAVALLAGCGGTVASPAARSASRSASGSGSGGYHRVSGGHAQGDPPTRTRQRTDPPAAAPTAGPELTTGQRLVAGQGRWSANREYHLLMQGDGNLVEYRDGKAVWNSATAGHPGAYAIMQGDGNLVVRRGATALWNASTENNDGASLDVTATGELVIDTSWGRPIWSSAVSGWSNRRLAAATIIVPADETSVSSVNAEVVDGAGGVILFGAAGPSDLGAQLATLKHLAPSGTNLAVMTDEEGGGVQRIANLVGNLPWPAQMGSSWTAAQITTSVATVARRMAADDINVDLAPVVDVDGRDVPPSATDPDGWRSFSGNTGTVSQDAVAYLKGLEQGGVLPVVKHFPGLGGASGNTDDAPAHTLPWSTLQKVALPPFVAAIKAGVPAVMVSNATVPGLSSLPASLSPTVVDQELLGVLHFRGLVVTDTLSAGAISGAGYSVPAATVQALRSGVDMTMYTDTVGAVATDQAFNAIISAVLAALANGTLHRSTLVAAATAIHAAG